MGEDTIQSFVKQRYENINHAIPLFGATTNFNQRKIKPYPVISKNQIMLLARKGLSGHLITKMCHCSSSVRSNNLRVAWNHTIVWLKLPKHLCFDEFSVQLSLWCPLSVVTLKPTKLSQSYRIVYHLPLLIILKVVIQSRTRMRSIS